MAKTRGADTLKLSIFGRFRAADPLGNEIPIKSKKARALLAYLALPPGKKRSREEVMALLWSERGDEQARSSLRQALSGLRKELGEIAVDVLKITDESLALDPDFVVVEKASPGDVLLAGLHISDPAFDEWLRDERLRDEDAAGRFAHRLKQPPYDKPRVVVLPFVNISGDPEQEYFSDGMTEDIITELSRFHALSVIARNSAFHYKGKSPKIQDLTHELDVGYVVEGSVRKAGNRVRITAQLVDATTGDHVWAERYDRDLEDIFAVQDEVTRVVVSTVAGRIDLTRNQRATRLSPESLQAYDLILRAKSICSGFTGPDNAAARESLKRAIALDPTNAEARAVLCGTYYLDWLGHWVEDSDNALNESIRCGKEAVAVDDAECRAHWNLGVAYLFSRQFDKARFHFEKAVSLNPNDVENRSTYGMFLSSVGEVPAAMVEFEWARQVDPQDLIYLPWHEGFAHFTAKQYDQAIFCFERIEEPHYEVQALLAASYAYVGRLSDAKAMLEEFLRKAEEEMVDFPGRSAAAWKRTWHSLVVYKDEADVEHLLDGLCKAGLGG